MSYQFSICRKFLRAQKSFMVELMNAASNHYFIVKILNIPYHFTYIFDI
jgi:hypothetical protein